MIAKLYKRIILYSARFDHEIRRILKKDFTHIGNHTYVYAIENHYGDFKGYSEQVITLIYERGYKCCLMVDDTNTVNIIQLNTGKGSMLLTSLDSYTTSLLISKFISYFPRLYQIYDAMHDLVCYLYDECAKIIEYSILTRTVTSKEKLFTVYAPSDELTINLDEPRDVDKIILSLYKTMEIKTKDRKVYRFSANKIHCFDDLCRLYRSLQI